MNKSLLWRSVFIGLAILYAGYIAFICIPYSVNKHYIGEVDEGNHTINHVLVDIKGKVYRGVFQTNEFIGVVQIDGHNYPIHTFRDRRFLNLIEKAFRFPYPYLGVVTKTDAQNDTVTTATIDLSGDFNSIYANTEAISKKYGKNAEFRASATH